MPAVGCAGQSAIRPIRAISVPVTNVLGNLYVPPEATDERHISPDRALRWHTLCRSRLRSVTLPQPARLPPSHFSSATMLPMFRQLPPRRLWARPADAHPHVTAGIRSTASLKIERVTSCTFQPQLERVDVRAFVFTERAAKTTREIREIFIGGLQLGQPQRKAHLLSG